MGLIFDGVDLEERFGLMVDGAATWPKPAMMRDLAEPRRDARPCPRTER